MPIQTENGYIVCSQILQQYGINRPVDCILKHELYIALFVEKDKFQVFSSITFL